MSAHRLGQSIAEMERGSRLVKHSAVCNAGIAFDTHPWCSALRPTGRIGDTRQAIGNPGDSKRCRRFRAHSEGTPVTNAMSKSKSEIVEGGGSEGVRPSQGTRVVPAASNLPAGGSDN